MTSSEKSYFSPLTNRVGTACELTLLGRIEDFSQVAQFAFLVQNEVGFRKGQPIVSVCRDTAQVSVQVFDTVQKGLACHLLFRILDVELKVVVAQKNGGRVECLFEQQEDCRLLEIVEAFAVFDRCCFGSEQAIFVERRNLVESENFW